MLPLALGLSSLVGLSLALLGGGGTLLMVPILRYVLGTGAREAIAMSLLVVGLTSLAALFPYLRSGRVRLRTGMVFGAAGMVGAGAAGHIAQYVPQVLLLVALSVMMIATAIAMLRRRCGEPESAWSPHREPALRKLPWAKLLAEGLAVGGVTGLVGAGGGFLVVPALVLLGGVPMQAAIGTALVVIAMKSLAGFVAFAGHTPIDVPLTLAISLVALLGSLGGSWLALRISTTTLQRGFAWFLVGTALLMLVLEISAL